MTSIVEADMGEVQNRVKPDSALDVVTHDVAQAIHLRGLVGDLPKSRQWVVERR